MSKFLNRGESNVVQGSFRPTLISRAAAAFRSWNSRRTAIRELNAMPETLLRDIGIERYQIRDAVNNLGAFAEVSTMREHNFIPAARIRKAA